MRRILISLMLCLGLAAQTRADDHSGRVVMGLGLLYENGLEATVGYEAETRYHHAWEFFGNVYLKWDECQECGHICNDSFWHNYNTWSLGIAYKPAVHIGRNNTGRLRVGGRVGSDTDDVICGVTIGYEHSYTLRHGLQLFWQLKTDVMIEGEDLFITGVHAGIKF